MVGGMVREPMNTPEIPLATYRLQFNRDFTFAKATEIIPYLAALGISHCYASPYLRARPGSMKYDERRLRIAQISSIVGKFKASSF